MFHNKLILDKNTNILIRNNMISEIFISVALLLTSASLVLSPLIFRLATNLSYKKKIKKAVKKFEQKANEKLKEIEQKKAELENSVKAYDEKFSAVHQVLTDFQIFVTDRLKDTMSDAEKENIKDDIDKFSKLI